MRENFPMGVLAIEVFSVALLLALLFVLQQTAVFATRQLHADQPKADAPSITRFLNSLTNPGPVSSNSHDCPVDLISTIRLDFTLTGLT